MPDTDRLKSQALDLAGEYAEAVFNLENEFIPGETGNIVVKLPLPPSSLPTLWNDDNRYVESYLKKYPV